jgi:hypothetical protein
LFFKLKIYKKMADCLITKGKTLSCKNAVGGYRAAYFINYGQGVEFTSLDGSVSTITGLTAGDAYKYELKATTNTFQQDVTTSRDAGTTFFSQVAVLIIPKLTVDMTNQLKFMSAGRPHIVIEDNMGNFLLVGEENGADLTAGTIATGGGLGDFNGYNLTFTAEEPNPVAHLSPTAITTLLASVDVNI